ncbi:UNVERIFIED_CONTAM: peptide/nickel transport system permease protein [Brevibacillus sp. OAP136]
MPEGALNVNSNPKSTGKQPERNVSFWYETWLSVSKSKFIAIGMGIVLFFVLIALLAPWLGTHDYKEPDLPSRLHAPSIEHWFGTDELGRDLFTRVVFGARLSLWVGFTSVMISIVCGSFLGIIAGYYGMWMDTIISRFFDILLAFPGILLAIIIVATLGPSIENVLIALAVLNTPVFGRLIRSKCLSLKQEEFIVAAKAIGMRDRRILLHHILPNSVSPVIVQGTLALAVSIIEAAGLGFLGLGAQPPEAEWGKMLADARVNVLKAPWTSVFPGAAILLTALGFTLIGEGLRDLLDPRRNKR